MLKQNAQNERVFRQSERLIVEKCKLQRYIHEARDREAKQWVLSYHSDLFKFARVERITDSYAVVDICLKTPEYPNACLIEDYFTVIFALVDNAELTFTVGLRE